jgi:hypothetical protein
MKRELVKKILKHQVVVGARMGCEAKLFYGFTLSRGRVSTFRR